MEFCIVEMMMTECPRRAYILLIDKIKPNKNLKLSSITSHLSLMQFSLESIVYIILSQIRKISDKPLI